MNSEDPFHAAHSDLLSLLSSTRPLLQSYLRIRRTSAAPSSSPELVEARRDLDASLADLDSDLRDLAGSVSAVERDPYRYGLDVAEVRRRRQLVADVTREVDGIRSQAAASGINPSSGSGGGGGNLPDPRAFALHDDDDDDHNGQGDDSYREFEEQRQQELLAEQDEALDGVSRTVHTLRQQANQMGQELEEQGELLDSVDQLTERVGDKLQTGLKRVAWIARKNEDTWSSCCIGVLILVLVVLLVLVLAI